MLTYQDYLQSNDKLGFLRKLIDQHKTSDAVRVALEAEEYYAQRNPFITNFVPHFYDMMGREVVDKARANFQLKNNFFHYLVNQRCNYSLGNGVGFEDKKTLEKLGKHFCEKLSEAGRSAIVQRMAFLFWNVDKVHVFSFAEFAPLWGEDGTLRGGVRFWQIDHEKPLFADFYEEDGYTRYQSSKGGSLKLRQEKRRYIHTYARTAVEAPQIIGEDNYSRLPIIPLYGSSLKQSALVGIKGHLDTYDMILSGLGNSVQDALQTLIVVSGADYIADDSARLMQLKDRMRAMGIVAAESGQISTQTIEPPYQAQSNALDRLKDDIFTSFGGLDVHKVMAGQTNDHIAAAYEPLNAAADDFEDCVTEAIRQLLELLGIDDEPSYQRRTTSNETEITANIINAHSDGLIDDETARSKLPFLTAEDLEGIRERLAAESMERFSSPRHTDTEEDEAGKNPA